jgi:phage minor structural protein
LSLIHIVNKQSDTILDDIRAGDVLSNEHYRSLKDTTETFEFVTFADKRYSPYLEKRNRVIIPDEDRGYAEFIITNSIKIHEQDNLVETEVYADASYLELKKSKVIEPQILNQYTVSMHAGFALEDTAWQLGIVESNNYRTIQIEDYTNPYAYLKRIANEFDLELNFRVEIEGNRIVGRYVDLVERIGVWRGVEVEFGRNLDGIRRNEKTKDIVTALIGLGPKPQEDENGNVPPRLEVYIEDNEALERWGYRDKNGNLQHLVDYYEVDSNDEDMTFEELVQYTRTELDKRIKEIVEYEANIHDLEHVPGLQNYRLRFGDTIRIKDTKFNPPLYMEARIHSQKRNIKRKQHKQVTLGDYVEFTEEEVTSVWEQLQQEIQTKIGLYEMLQHTYDKETIDEKDSIVLGDGKEYSRNVANTAETNAKDHADDVASEAERLANNYTDVQIDASESSILEQTVAQAVFDTTIADILGDLAGKADNSVVEDLESLIAGKVDAEWVEGQLVGKVDQEAYNTKIQELSNDISDKAGIEYVDGQLVGKANANEVYTITEIDGMFENVVSVTQYSTDMDGIVSDLSSHETRITQTEEDIQSTVTKTEFSTLEDEVGNIGTQLSTAQTNISQNADAIESKAESSTVNALTGEVTELESTVLQQAGLIEDRVTKTEYTTDMDGVISDLSNHESRITQTEKDITSKVEQTTFNTLEDEVGNIGTSIDNAWTQIDQNATDITSKASQSSVDTLSGEVTDLSSEVSQNAGKIASKVEETTFNDVTGSLGNRLTTVEQTADGLVIDVGSIETDVNDIEADISDIEGTLSSHNTRISSNANEIALKASSSEVDILEGRVDSAESEITANSTAINSRVTQSTFNSLAGRVSTAESNISQNASSISSKVDDGDVRSIFTQEAGSFTFDADQINFSGHVFGSDATFKGTVSGGEVIQDGVGGSIELDNEGFKVYDGGKNLALSMMISDISGLHGDDISIAFWDTTSHQASMVISQWYTDSQIWTDRALRLISENLGVYIETRDPVGYALRIGSGGVRIEATGLSNGLSFPDGHTITTGTQGHFTIFGNRSAGYPFRVRSNINGSSSRDEFWVAEDGMFYSRVLWDHTSSGNMNARVSYAHGDSDHGSLYRVVSARKYKTDIQPIDIDPYLILKIVPQSWIDKGELEQNGGAHEGLQRYYGLIADDVSDIGLTPYVEYAEGEVEGLAYDRLLTLLIPITSDHEEKIQQHDRDIEYIKNDLDWLQTENKLLKQRLRIVERELEIA